MRKPAVALLTFLSMTGIALPAQAQSLDQSRFGFVAAHDQAFESEVVIPAAPAGQQTHWKEGFIIGTVVGALVIYKAGVVGIDRFTPRVAIGLTAQAVAPGPDRRINTGCRLLLPARGIHRVPFPQGDARGDFGKVTVIVAMLTGD